MNTSNKLNDREKARRASIVIKDYSGIVPQSEAFYLHSIIYSAKRCLDSFAEYELLKNKDVDAEYLVSIVQEAVGHAAALSRYFWPSLQRSRNEQPLEQVKEKRGEKLREAFGLTKVSPLHNRDLRNAWEHFDERLDAYLLESDMGYFFPTCLIGSHTLADDPIGHIFKLLDPESECLVLMGSKYFFAPIHGEVETVLARAIEADRKGARLQLSSSEIQD